MYSTQTPGRGDVILLDELAAGSILVVDDDQLFGGFIRAALEARGHEVEWAGSVRDALGCLSVRQFDLVILDLRLPDGSGIEMLRTATDEGLLSDTAAIILTGHEFDEPNDIRVFHKPLDLEPFLDRMGDIIAHTQKRRGTGPKRVAALRGGTVNDSSPRRKATRIELVLYTSASSEKCRKAIRTVNAVLERYDSSQISFSICDLTTQAIKADEDSVVFTPTLVKRGPGPRTWIVGNLDQPELLVDLLEVSGVERKR
jgi:CheY-like chemotaxis protein